MLRIDGIIRIGAYIDLVVGLQAIISWIAKTLMFKSPEPARVRRFETSLRTDPLFPCNLSSLCLWGRSGVEGWAKSGMRVRLAEDFMACSVSRQVWPLRAEPSRPIMLGSPGSVPARV